METAPYLELFTLTPQHCENNNLLLSLFPTWSQGITQETRLSLCGHNLRKFYLLSEKTALNLDSNQSQLELASKSNVSLWVEIWSQVVSVLSSFLTKERWEKLGLAGYSNLETYVS